MRYFSFFLLCLFSIGLNAQALNQVITGGSSGRDRIMDVVASPTDEIVACGQFRQTVDFDPDTSIVNRTAIGGGDIFVTKYNSNGQLDWVYAAGGSSNADIARSLTMDQFGNTYVCGWFGGTVDFDPRPNQTTTLSSNGSWDAFLLKLDTSGNLLWARSFGGPGEDNAISIAYHQSRQIIISGRFADSVDFDPGNNTQMKYGSPSENAYLSAFDLNGNLNWNNAFSSSANFGNANGLCLDVSSSGRIYLSGTFYSSVDFNPNGSTPKILVSNGSNDAFVSLYDANGINLAAISWGGIGNDRATSVYVDANDEVRVGGFFYYAADFNPDTAISLVKSSAGSRDIFISSFDPNLVLKWNFTTGGPSAETIVDVATDQDNDVYATGYFYSPFDANPDSNITDLISGNPGGDFFLLNYDVTGKYLKGFATGGSGDDIGMSIAKKNGNNFLIGGNFGSTVDFDPSTATQARTSNGNQDFFIQDVFVCKDSYVEVRDTACQSYLSPAGNIYTNTGIYFDTIPNQAGCDSVIRTALELDSISIAANVRDSILSLIPPLSPNTTYQWLDCASAYAPISGADSSAYIAKRNGVFAVEVTNGSCIDTSSCLPVIISGLNEEDKSDQIKVYPNPSSGSYFIKGAKSLQIEILDMSGRQIKSFILNDRQQFELQAESGIYFISIELSDGRRIIKKLIKQ